MITVAAPHIITGENHNASSDCPDDKPTINLNRNRKYATPENNAKIRHPEVVSKSFKIFLFIAVSPFWREP